MKLPPIFSNRKYVIPALLLVLIGLVFLAVMAFNLGGDELMFTLGSVLNAPLAILITILAASIYRQMGIQKHPRGMWAGLVLCWALWAVAESLWFIFSLTGSEPPYPSWADLFWLLGYIPLLAGLISRFRSLPNKLTPLQGIITWLISLLIVVAAGFFVIKPTIEYWGEGSLLENLPNIIYPVADLIVAIIILRLFFSFERGDYGFGWRLIAVGFFLLTIADLVFTYATWEEIYYPDMKANLVSRLFVDAPYTLSYLFWLLGIFALGILLRQQKPARKILAPIHIPRYAHIILSVAADDTILGRHFFQALPVSDRDTNLLISGLHNDGRVSDLPVLFLNSSGTLHALKICGMAIKDASGAYLGSNLLVRFPVENASADSGLSQESRGLAEYIMATCDSSFPTEVGDFLLEYYLVYLEELFQLADKEGGATMTASLVESLKDICARHNWPLQFNQQTGITRAGYPLDILRQSLPFILQSAREFITRVEDENTVETKIQEVHAQIAPDVHAEVARYLKQGVALSG